MVTFQVSQFMGHHRLDLRQGQQIQQGGVDDHEGLLAPHGEGVGIGDGVLADVEGGRLQIQDLGSFLEKLVEVGQLAIADQNAGGHIFQVKILLSNRGQQVPNHQIKTGQLFEGSGGLVV
ncbi:hypothetical protein PROH_18995 [Prochlorothrix hollandica PCC 9006 = CALU 1027]|uniref:Uncharacterized protein n=1 Tax=Prochlorothrix hollandica PCC 9006 = CALU 1027 TaxID=317619 RepID=A0A0M2PTP1_PROHO|nr:hypothetical protein PROH_18995 [Prochlorothrix hollandica PCC 9006 = CALU 1027]